MDKGTHKILECEIQRTLKSTGIELFIMGFLLIYKINSPKSNKDQNEPLRTTQIPAEIP